MSGHEPFDVSPERQVGVALDLFPTELQASSATTPLITSADRLVPPWATFSIPWTSSSAAVPFTR